jgi:hypothetical protein
MPVRSSASPEICLVDAHVHLHPRFRADVVLDSAARNFAAAARGAGLPDRPPCFLLLVEIAGVDAFGALPERAGRWRLLPTGEALSRRAEPDSGGAPVFIVAGRQSVTAEGLEVLALGTREHLADGLALRATVEAVRQAGALPVLPWGFGKWTGRRGALVREAAADPAAFPCLYLADSGVRPRFLLRPAPIAEAERAGRISLAGTDPLPVRGDEGKAGRFGFVAATEVDKDRPFGALADWIGRQRASPPVFGALERPAVFLHRQLAMQLRKRFPARRG